MAAIVHQQQQQSQSQPQPLLPQNQTETQAPPPQRPACKRELDHLVDIKIENSGAAPPLDVRKRLVLREALDEWKEQVRTLEGSVEKRTKRTDQLTNEIYQLVGLYSVFVGVVFTAVLQSTRVECQHIWSPVVLYVVAYFVLLVVIIKKSREIEINRATIKEDLTFRKIRLGNIRNLKFIGPRNFNFSHHTIEPKVVEDSATNTEEGHKKDSEASNRPRWLIAILTFFTLVLLFSFIHILCLNIKSSCSCASVSAPK